MGGVPASGGKRMAMKPRKMSDVHIFGCDCQLSFLGFVSAMELSAVSEV